MSRIASAVGSLFSGGRMTWPALATVAGLQALVLGWMVYDRVALLSSGREIVAEVIPVDPRDIFRGEYVILNYGFTRTAGAQPGQTDVEVPKGVKEGDRVYVTLVPKGPAVWEMTSVAADYPAATGNAEAVVLKGMVTNVWSPAPEANPKANIRYGIESYFVPEGQGKALEDKVREKKIAAVLAVGANGETAIKALMVDGQRIVEEPWF